MGLKQGKGKLIFPSGLGTYEGEFHGDKMDGEGILVLHPSKDCGGIEELMQVSATAEKGLTYEGHFENGVLNGHGKMERDGGIYEGAMTYFQFDDTILNRICLYPHIFTTHAQECSWTAPQMAMGPFEKEMEMYTLEIFLMESIKIIWPFISILMDHVMKVSGLVMSAFDA